MRFRGRRALSYAAAALIPGLVLVSRCDGSFSLPFIYDGDLLGLAAFVKTLIRGDWAPLTAVHSASLGAPFGGYDMGDYPTPEPLQHLMLKILGLFSANPFWIINIYYALGFALVGLAARWSFRRLGISVGFSTLAAVLYALLPFHFTRYGHLFLANYAVVPLTLPPLLWLWKRKPVFFRRHGDGWHWDFGCSHARSLVLIALIAGFWHIYYAFFFAGFLVIAGLSAGLLRRSWRHTLSGFLGAAIVATSLCVALAPNLAYRKSHAPSREHVAERRVVESQVWGLQLTALTLPSPDHRLGLFRGLRAKFPAWPDVVEGWTESIGTFGDLGLGVLLVAGLMMVRRESRLAKLSVLTVAGLLFATRSGFVAYFSSLVSPQLRSVNRISVYLAAFSFAGAAIWLDQRRCLRSRAARGMALASLLVWGLYDQITPGMQFSNAQRAAYESDAAFVAEIEQRVPAGAALLQLPYVPYPETGRMEQLADNGHFRAYLHSDHLRWSHGAMRGRPAADRIRDLANALSPSALREAGYAGLYLDRRGFADKGIALETQLRKLLRQVPLVSSDGQLLFFSL